MFTYTICINYITFTLVILLYDVTNINIIFFLKYEITLFYNVNLEVLIYMQKFTLY